MRDEAWFERVRERMNADPELGIIGRHFNVVIGLTFDDRRHDIEIREGRIVDIRHQQKIDSRVDFGFRAPTAVWDRFLRPDPPPLHTTIFALFMRVPEFRIEGDTLKLAQNARAIQRFFGVLQEMGVRS